MLLFAHVLSKRELPKGKEWGQILIYGFLNITLYKPKIYQAI